MDANSGHGKGDIFCCKDDNLPVMLLGLLSIALFLNSVITMALGRKRRRKRSSLTNMFEKSWPGT